MGNSYFMERENFFEFIKQPRDKENYLLHSTAYYLKVFDTYYKTDNPNPWFIHWNWGAFLFGPIWMAYRQLYLPAIGLMLLEIACTFLVTPWDIITQLLFGLVLGNYGSALYLIYVSRWIKENQTNRKGVSYLIPLFTVVLPWLVISLFWLFYSSNAFFTAK